MNDKEKLLRDYARMCRMYKANGSCNGCPLFFEQLGNGRCEVYMEKHLKESVEIIEYWAAEQPVKTRQDMFLKMFPNAWLNSNGIIDINPCALENKMECKSVYGTTSGCAGCRRNYWSQEVE